MLVNALLIIFCSVVSDHVGYILKAQITAAVTDSLFPTAQDHRGKLGCTYFEQWVNGRASLSIEAIWYTRPWNASP